MDAYQEQIINEQFPDSFPVKCSAFEKIAAKAEKGGCSISTEFYDGRLRNTGALKKEDAERLELFIRSANKATRTDQRIKTIVYEETDIFLAGEQTAEEAADMLRATLDSMIENEEI